MSATLDANIMLESLVAMIRDGKPMDKEYAEQIEGALSHWQAKIDIVQIGLSIQQIARTSDLAMRVGMVEDQIFGPEGVNLMVMEDKDKIRLLGLLNNEFRSTLDFIGHRSMKPTITSSETMRKVPSQSLGEQETARLPAESRNRVRGVLTRMLARMDSEISADIETIDAEIVPPTA